MPQAVNDIQTQTMADKVKEIRRQARELCREKAVSRYLSSIQSLESRIADFQDYIESAQKDVTEADLDLKVAEYDKAKLDPEHPRHAKQLENADKVIKLYTDRLAQIQESADQHIKANEKAIKDLEGDIALLEEKIAKIESGETKITREHIDELAEKLIVKV